jgi:hypothetical protein
MFREAVLREVGSAFVTWATSANPLAVRFVENVFPSLFLGDPGHAPAEDGHARLHYLILS